MVDKINKTAEIYKNILEATKQYNEKELNNWDIDAIITKAKLYLYGVSIIEKYGLNIDPSKINNFGYNKLNDYISIGYWGKIHGRTISWLDNGEQPEDEVLVNIGFPTGAYIFGDDYPEGLFNRFFNELKSYNPKYSDSANKALFFTPETSNEVFNSFNNILNKYREINKSELKKRKIDKMKSELKKLEDDV